MNYIGSTFCSKIGRIWSGTILLAVHKTWVIVTGTVIDLFIL